MNERDIFTAARQLPGAADRDAFLDEACSRDQDLRRRVVALLEEQDQLGTFLEHGEPPVVTVDDPVTERPGTVIGPYKLLERIGEGGMGTVWMARQTEPVKRLVAVKLIKPGMDSGHVVARFEAERQALAVMDHANIARVLDGGTTCGGRPYFAMDLVKGVPITTYCDEHHLAPRHRLELFVPVCQAVQHAHQKGVIHRDLKPSNVLVALYDGTPVPKVIDFGVAKGAGHQLTEKTLVTGFGAVVGTLEYMSPEQAQLNNHDIDTRSDIYSLGVLLYELLTGTTPLERTRVKESGMLEALRIIREEDAPTLSNRLATTAELPAIAANRGLEPAKLTNLVRGELDWIVMRALEKDRNRRYETATALAADVQRYLHDEPVEASPRSRVYRLRKFLRRNKGPAVAASLALLTLIAGITGTSWGLLSAEKNRRKAEDALTAETEARRAERQARDHAMAALRSMTDEIVQDQLARGTHLRDEDKEFLRRILKHFDGFAAITSDDVEGRSIRAEGAARVGVIRHRLGELAEAEAALTEAVHILKALAAEFPDRPGFRQELARSHGNLGTVLRARGRSKEAEASFADALAIYTHLEADASVRPEVRQNSAGTYSNLGNLLSTLGRSDEAEAAHAEALARQKQLTAAVPTRPEFRRDMAISHSNLGNLFHATGRLKEAAASFADAVAIQKQLATDFPTRSEFRQHLAGSLMNIGVLLRGTGRWKEAEAAYTEALAIYKRLAADFPALPEFRHLLAASQNNLARLLNDTGRVKDAEAAYADALAIQRGLVADFPTRPEFRLHVARSLNNLGVLLKDAGRLSEAEAAYTEALAMSKQLTAEHPTPVEFRQELGTSHINTGVLLRATGRWKEAEAAYAEALATYQRLAADFPALPEFRYHLALAHSNLARIYGVTSRLKEAESAYADALTIQQKLAAEFPARPEFRLNLARSHNNLGSLLKEAGRWPEAEAAHTKALTITRQLTAGHPAPAEFRQELASSHNNLGVVFRVTGRLMEAQSAYADAVTIKKQLVADAPTRPDLRHSLAGTLGNLALVAAQRKDYSAAKGYLEETLPHHRAALTANPRHPDYREAYRNNLIVLASTNAWMNDQAGAVLVAGQIRALGWDPARDTYDAARTLAHCGSVAQRLEQLDAGQRQAAGQFYGDQAMAMLRDAVARGWNDAARMTKDTDLDTLRQREDFQNLVKELERK